MPATRTERDQFKDEVMVSPKRRIRRAGVAERAKPVEVALLGEERHPVARIGLRIGVVVQQQTTPGRGHRRLRRPLRAQFIGQAQGIGQHDIHGLGRRIVGIPQAGDPVQCDLARIRDVDSGQVDPY
ncbi:hypothetical protein G6F31_019979 [Rhizopus arrhizus]|nr:hypothetical protein G6F31_019979 [Rhizopus arrhizus]